MGVKTVHESAASALLDKMMSTAEGMQAIWSYHKGIQGGRWSRAYVDAIGQMPSRLASPWPMQEVAAFGVVHTWIGKGCVGMAEIEVGDTPCHDAARFENAAALIELPSPFTATVDQGQNCEPGDGNLFWRESIEVTVCTGETEADGTTPVTQFATVEPSHTLLEIGTTMPSRTCMHLIQSGSAARWAYGSKYIRLLVSTGLRPGPEDFLASYLAGPED